MLQGEREREGEELQEDYSSVTHTLDLSIHMQTMKDRSLVYYVKEPIRRLILVLLHNISLVKLEPLLEL